MEKKAQTSCESCLYFEYDEEYDEYFCVMDLDEDDYANFLTGRTESCPFYRFGDEYLIVHKQI
ncbi:MAG: hypothetical protein IJK77_04745 [Lachnospiraceae bacterium]|nr:hypothetical protein [Lachnospiraceae bacterium]